MSVTRYFLGTFLALLLSTFSLSGHAQLKLNEGDVVTLILRQNLGVLADSFEPQIAETLITEVLGQFDIIIDGSASYQLDKSDKESIVFGTDNRSYIYEAQASKKIPYGVEGAVSFSNKLDTTNSAFATDPEFFDTRLTFSARANLLRNRFGKTDQGEINLAKAQKDITTQLTLSNVEDQVYRAVRVYWNLVAANYFLRLANRFSNIAKEFLKVTQEKKVIGLSEDPDVLAAKAQVKLRATEVLRANNLIKDFEEQLRTALNLRSSISIKPKDSLKFTPPGNLTQTKAFREALTNRHDYRALFEEAKSKDIRMAVAKDQKLPGLDLVTSLELNSVDPNYGTALGQTFSGQNPNWIVGVEFNLSFENRLAKSSLTRNQLEKAQLLVKIKQMENNIALEINEIFREYVLQEKEAKNFREISGLQKAKLDIENKNYLLGRSSSDIIVRFQNDWLDAEKERLNADLRQIQAWVDIRRSMSTLIPYSIKKLPSETR